MYHCACSPCHLVVEKVAYHPAFTSLKLIMYMYNIMFIANGYMRPVHMNNENFHFF